MTQAARRPRPSSQHRAIKSPQDGAVNVLSPALSAAPVFKHPARDVSPARGMAVFLPIRFRYGLHFQLLALLAIEPGSDTSHVPLPHLPSQMHLPAGTGLWVHACVHSASCAAATSAWPGNRGSSRLMCPTCSRRVAKRSCRRCLPRRHQPSSPGHS